jgi:hypothetical protein
MMKLHAHDRAKLVAFAYEAGLVMPRADTSAIEGRTLRQSA